MGTLSKANWTKLKNKSKRYSVGGLFFKVVEKLQSPYRDYASCYKNYMPDAEEIKRQKETTFSQMPKISIVVPTYETRGDFLRDMIDSVCNQTYPNWELCLADGSISNAVKEVVEQEYANETRIRYKKLSSNKGISENTNAGLQMAEGDYLALLDHDDFLVPSALYEMVKRINDTDADFLYSDEDMVSEDGTEYMTPHFKLDFNRELLLGNNYICHFLVVARQLWQKVGGLDASYDGAQDYEFILRCSRHAKQMEHIPKILYHWRIHSASTAGNTDSKEYAYEAGKRAIEAYLAEENWNGKVSLKRDLGFYQVDYQIPQNVTIGIRTWGQASRNWEKIQKALAKELEKFAERVHWNYAWGQPADFVIVINVSAQSIKENSVTTLVADCNRFGIAMVGARTLKAGKVYQCGYWKKEEAYVPRFFGLPRQFVGYFHRAELPVETDALSNDLVVIKTSVFTKLEINSVCEESLSTWQQFCEEEKKLGNKLIVEPRAEITC